MRFVLLLLVWALHGALALRGQSPPVQTEMQKAVEEFRIRTRDMGLRAATSSGSTWRVRRRFRGSMNASVGPFSRNNYFLVSPATNNANGAIIKLDHSLRERRRISVEYVFAGEWAFIEP